MLIRYYRCTSGDNSGDRGHHNRSCLFTLNEGIQNAPNVIENGSSESLAMAGNKQTKKSKPALSPLKQPALTITQTLRTELSFPLHLPYSKPLI